MITIYVLVMWRENPKAITGIEVETHVRTTEKVWEEEVSVKKEGWNARVDITEFIAS